MKWDEVKGRKNEDRKKGLDEMEKEGERKKN